MAAQAQQTRTITSLREPASWRARKVSMATIICCHVVHVSSGSGRVGGMSAAVETVPDKQSMIYLMQRVQHVQMEYAHIQQVQIPGVDIGTSSWAHEAWHALHGQYDPTKVRLIESRGTEDKLGDWRRGRAPRIFQ
jgi:hypothetical protein